MAAILPTPRIHVYHTKTAGYQVIYISRMKRQNLLQRRLDRDKALEYGRAASRVYGVPLEVDDE